MSEFSYYTICSGLVPLDDTDPIDIAETASQMDPPSFFTGYDRFLDPDEPDEFKMVYSTGIPEPPDRGIERTVFEFNYQKERDGFHIHTYTTDEYYDEVAALHNQLFSLDGQPTINHGSVVIELDEDTDLSLSKEGPANSDLSAVEYATDDFVISVYGYRGENLFSVLNQQSEENAENVTNYIDRTKDEAREILDEITQ